MSDEWKALCVGGGNNDLWDAFCSWAESNGIGTHEDDWRAWWNCYSAGADACHTQSFAKMQAVLKRGILEMDAITGGKA